MIAMRRVAVRSLVLGLVLLPAVSGPQGPPRSTGAPGQSTALLSDGRWLRLGGAGTGGPSGRAEIVDPRTGVSRQLSAELAHPRAWHTATVLPDGSVLILGGTDRHGRVVEEAERFRPETEDFEPLALTPPDARAYHTATVLTDGRLLLVGGISATGTAWSTAEVWDPDSGTGVMAPTDAAARSRHTATLLATGEVLISGGVDARGALVADDELFDPDGGTFGSAVGLPAGPPWSNPN